MKVLKPHSRIERPHCKKNRIHKAKQNVGLVLALVGLISAATLVTGPIRLACAQGIAQSWSYTGNLNIARAFHTATLLPDGKVLVAGGACDTGILDSAELYDPDTGTWSVTGSLHAPRDFHTATLLPDGKVLVVGGSGGRDERNSVLNSAELYDPETGIWSVTGSLNTHRINHTATLLQNGKVLVAGGVGGRYFVNSGGRYFINSAELYDPATGMWSFTGNLNAAIESHTATLLQDGRVLVAGGSNPAELYDPDTGTWSSVGNTNGNYRVRHTATLLPDGRVLIVGGDNDDDFNPVCFNTAELYNPNTGSWSSTGHLNSARTNHTAILLPDGEVLVAGGSNSGPLVSSELYDPVTETWGVTGGLLSPRDFHTATLLPDGKVLVAGGVDGKGLLKSAELYGAATNSN